MTVSAAHEMALRTAAHPANVLNCLDGHVRHPVRADFSPANAIELVKGKGFQNVLRHAACVGKFLKGGLAGTRVDCGRLTGCG